MPFRASPRRLRRQVPRGGPPHGGTADATCPRWRSPCCTRFAGRTQRRRLAPSGRRAVRGRTMRGASGAASEPMTSDPPCSYLWRDQRDRRRRGRRRHLRTAGFAPARTGGPRAPGNCPRAPDPLTARRIRDLHEQLSDRTVSVAPAAVDQMGRQAVGGRHRIGQCRQACHFYSSSMAAVRGVALVGKPGTAPIHPRKATTVQCCTEPTTGRAENPGPD
jgi:hypothetical protein